ncbi:MAG: YihY/virulence factor BrkB family protein [Acidobacteria bacterium]|nr:YihY/virulence factor BrkB family protein [Acidobacteriota bacterium]MBP8273148.1 YihY/virulence factor BrkB family protein [Acidobacteriota bacterium]
MRTPFDIPIRWGALLRRTLRETLNDDAQGLAAQLAYYFFLSLFPMLLALVALASLFPLQHLTDDVVRFLRPVMPGEAIGIIRAQMLHLAEGDDVGLISVGVAGAVWSSSAAMGALVNAMNRAYDLDETRPWWQVRLLAVALTIGLAFFVLTSLTLVLAGPQLVDLLTRRIGMGEAWQWAWKIGQWPLVTTMVGFGIGLIYYFAPDAEQDWVWITPGSILATSLWLIGSLGFRLYVVHLGGYESTYGAIGGMIILLLWFYVTALVIVIGAELNAEIEHAAPWATPVEQSRAPRARAAIGRAAERRYRATQTRPARAPQS